MGYSIAEGWGQTAGNIGSITPAAEFSLATDDNGQGLRQGGGQGLVINGMRASSAPQNEIYLPDLHTLDSNPYAQLVANGEGELLTGQDYWNQARNRADSALTARYQDYYTQEAAQINAQRQADAAQAATARNQLESNYTTSSVNQGVQARNRNTTVLPENNTAAGFINGSGDAAVGYLRAGRRSDPTVIPRINARMQTQIDEWQTDAVRDGNPVKYVLAGGFVPRSVQELVLGTALGPMASRVIGAGIGVLNSAAAGTFLTADLGAVTGRALNEVVEFGAERLGRLNEGLGMQPALVENTGAKVTNKSANLFLDEVSTNWRGHEAAVVGRLQSTLGDDFAPKVYLRVETPSGNAYTIIPDGLERSGNSFIVHDAKFSQSKDLMNLPTEQLRNTFTTNQKPAFDAIAAGEAKVTLLNSQGGRALLGRDVQVGKPINVQPSINLYVNTPSGIVKRTWP